MSLGIIRDASIEDMYRVSFCKVGQINKIPALLQEETEYKPAFTALSGIFVPAYANSQDERPSNLSNTDIIGLRDRLTKLDRSVQEYSRLNIFWKIIGIFSGTFWKYKRLQRCLPEVIKTVNAIAIAALEAEKPLPPALTPAQRVAKKKTLVEMALTAVNTAESLGALEDPVHEKQAQAYLQKILGKLNNGEDVPLPLWFHATGSTMGRSSADPYASVAQIISEKQIVQATPKVGTGRGVFISTCDESGEAMHQYGPWTFAIDEKVLERCKGGYFPAENTVSQNFFNAALWVCVKKNIPITADSVAFMIADAERVDELRKKVLIPNNFNVEVLNRRVARHVYKFLEIANNPRQLPSPNWDPHVKDPQQRVKIYPMPQNFRHLQVRSLGNNTRNAA